MKVENEQGEIVEFARQASEAGFKILSIRTEYPDAIIEKDGVEYWAEFEFEAYNWVPFIEKLEQGYGGVRYSELPVIKQMTFIAL